MSRNKDRVPGIQSILVTLTYEKEAGVTCCVCSGRAWEPAVVAFWKLSFKNLNTE